MMATAGTNIYEQLTRASLIDPGMIAWRTELLGKTAALEAEIHQFVDTIRSNRVKALQEEYAGLVVSCRAAMDEVIKLQSELAAAQTELLACANRSEKARNDVTEFLSTRPPASIYPTKAELKAWEGRRVAIEQRRDDLVQAERQAQYRYGFQQSLLAEARRKFAPLKQREETLRAELANAGIDVTAMPEPETAEVAA